MSNPRKRIGRPRLAPGGLPRLVTLRFSAIELRLIDAASAAAGQSRGAWIRARLQVEVHRAALALDAR